MEYLFQGLPFYTMSTPTNPGQAVAESMVVENGVILSVGTRQEMAHKHPLARKIDLDGGAVIPAFNDCHCHIMNLGLELRQADLRQCTSFAEISAALKKWAADNPESVWIEGGAYNQNNLVEGRHINRTELDALFPDQPVILSHTSGHAAVVNSKVLKLACIDVDTPDPSDGVIERDANGHPTGVLLEYAMDRVEAILPEPSNKELAECILNACEHMSKKGILIASDAFTGFRFNLDNEWKAYAKALDMGARMRITLMPDVDSAAKLGWRDRSQVIQPANHSNLRLGAIKIMTDGALSSRTAAMLEPFEDVDTTGILVYEPEELIDRIVKSHVGGWQVATHAIGDYAIKLCLDGFEKALSISPRNDCRHRIEHCMVVNDRLLDRMKELKITACAQPEFIYGLGGAYRKGLGKRAETLMPYRTWLDRSIPMCFGSDQPVVKGDPILGWRAAVNRTGQDGATLGPQECLDPLTALKGFTVGAALATFDDEVGSLEPGKQARFVVLSHKPEEILDPDMKVLATSNDLMEINASATKSGA